MKFASIVTAFVALALPGADADTKIVHRRERANDELAGRRQQSRLRSGFDRQLEGSLPLIGAEISVPLLENELSLPLVEAPNARKLVHRRERANDKRSGFDRQLEGSLPLIGAEISVPLLENDFSLPLVEAPNARKLVHRRELENDELSGFDRQLEGSLPLIGAEISVPLLENDFSLPLVEDPNARKLVHRRVRANNDLAGRRQQSRLRAGFERQLEGSLPLIGAEISVPLLENEISLPLVTAEMSY